MAIHLTPDELSDALGLKSKDVIRMCQEESVPILHGRIDKTLFFQTMQATGHRMPDDADLLLDLH